MWAEYKNTYASTGLRSTEVDDDEEKGKKYLRYMWKIASGPHLIVSWAYRNGSCNGQRELSTIERFYVLCVQKSLYRSHLWIVRKIHKSFTFLSSCWFIQNVSVRRTMQKWMSRWLDVQLRDEESLPLWWTEVITFCLFAYTPFSRIWICSSR